MRLDRGTRRRASRGYSRCGTRPTGCSSTLGEARCRCQPCGSIGQAPGISRDTDKTSTIPPDDSVTGSFCHTRPPRGEPRHITCAKHSNGSHVTPMQAAGQPARQLERRRARARSSRAPLTATIRSRCRLICPAFIHPRLISRPDSQSHPAASISRLLSTAAPVSDSPDLA